MGKINLDKSGDFSPVRTERQRDVVKKTAKDTTQIVENKRSDSSDKLDISGRGSEVGKLVGKIKELPDVRQEKINNLREQVASGDYKPSSERIADAILKDGKL